MAKLKISSIILLTILCICSTVAQRRHSKRRQGNAKKPNIVLIMTDDQDSELGSMNYMPKTLQILQEGGAKFTNSFTNSPICCPSRSSFLTGLHVHNHNVWTNNDNCSSLHWQQNFENRGFATYLQKAGYRTGYFGKYLNDYDGNHIPAGWNEWVGLIRNSAFYNYTVNFNGQLQRHGSDYHKDYFTDLIANDSITFFKQSKQYFSRDPVAMVLSMPAPHGPEDAAPQYQNMFFNASDHRTPNWNYAPNPDKQFLLQITGKMEPIQVEFSNLLQTKRLQTLQSVDDAVEKVYNELRDLNELDNTYIIFLSDHGYHLGQFGIPKGKSMPYDFDTRIPLYMRGPGIQPGLKISNLVGMIDVAPTLIDLAGGDIPEHMDGTSMKSLLGVSSNLPDGEPSKKKAWRDTFLIERGKMRRSLIDDDYDLSESSLPIYFTNNGGLEDRCSKDRFKYPCNRNQKLFCHRDDKGRSRMRKCKNLTKPCECLSDRRHRNKREADSETVMNELAEVMERTKRAVEDEDGSFVQQCRIVNETVQCSSMETYFGSWDQQRRALDSLIDDYKSHLEKLKDLRRELRKGYVDFTKYSPRGSSSAPSSEQPVRRTSSSTTTPALVNPPKPLDCLCEEDDVSYHDIYRETFDSDEAVPDNSSGALGKREQKRAERTKKKQGKRKNKKEIICEPNDRKCLRKKRKSLLPTKRNNPHCQVEGAECTIMDNDHWKTEPRWTAGPFCYCNNAQSNVFWCLRTINETHNFLYCEYITGFLSFYNMKDDPWMLNNAIFDLSYDQLGQLHNLLVKQRKCKGAKECSYRYRQKILSEPTEGGRSSMSSPTFSKA